MFMQLPAYTCNLIRNESSKFYHETALFAKYARWKWVVNLCHIYFMCYRRHFVVHSCCNIDLRYYLQCVYHLNSVWSLQLGVTKEAVYSWLLSIFYLQCGKKFLFNSSFEDDIVTRHKICKAIQTYSYHLPTNNFKGT